MAGAPLVTIVMPSFGQARFLRDAIDSVLGQDHPRVELLVVDGGSTDGSVAILEGYGSRLSFTSERDRGQSDAINKGFRRARGEIVAWLNSDDRYLPGAIAAAVAALQARPDAAMVYGEGELIDEGGALLGRFEATQPFDLWKLAFVSDYVMQPAVFLRAERLREAGLLDESLHYAMDWDLWLRLAYRWPVVHLARVLAQTREYGATKTARGGWRRLRELRRLARAHTGSGWTPAVRAYGLDTLRKRWPRLFGATSLAQVEWLRRSRLARACAPLHRRVTRAIERQLRSQDVWPDGWSGPRAWHAVPWPARAARVEVAGEVVPATTPLPLVVEARAAGRRARIELRAPGPFTLALDVPPRSGEPRALPIAVRASRWHVPPGDWRRLAYRTGGARLL
jgi:hypothetical protein